MFFIQLISSSTQASGKMTLDDGSSQQNWEDVMSEWCDQSGMVWEPSNWERSVPRKGTEVNQASGPVRTM